MKKLLLAAAIAIGFTVSISLPTQAMAETKKGYYEHIEGLITKIRLDATGRKYFVLKTRNKGLFRVYFTEKDRRIDHGSRVAVRGLVSNKLENGQRVITHATLKYKIF